jgi:hypothetical protein
MNFEFDSSKVFNGIVSELIAATLSYPLNTIKTNSQIGKKIIIGKNLTPLFRGIHWCLLTEIINSVSLQAYIRKGWL